MNCTLIHSISTVQCCIPLHGDISGHVEAHATTGVRFVCGPYSDIPLSPLLVAGGSNCWLPESSVTA